MEKHWLQIQYQVQHVCVFDVGGEQRSQRKTSQTLGEHANTLCGRGARTHVFAVRQQ